MLKQVGKMVEIEDRLIPAINIQVEGVPGYFEMSVGRPMWFGIYFEVKFEDGALWVVSQGDDPDDQPGCVMVYGYENWSENSGGSNLDDADYCLIFKNWESFLDIYNFKTKPRRLN